MVGGIVTVAVRSSLSMVESDSSLTLRYSLDHLIGWTDLGYSSAPDDYLIVDEDSWSLSLMVSSSGEKRLTDRIREMRTDRCAAVIMALSSLATVAGAGLVCLTLKWQVLCGGPLWVEGMHFVADKHDGLSNASVFSGIKEFPFNTSTDVRNVVLAFQSSNSRLSLGKTVLMKECGTRSYLLLWVLKTGVVTAFVWENVWNPLK
ncbi:hypothetical protein Tco_0890840 [Tanacetum coccineum]|uniref:Uncharacterized protein n=1 Tax=Tanacetum coccineum TaxID=301880 RepID=A0ABQ5C2S7_9ASTR